jgi:cytochrome c oxidase subunit 1
MLASLGLFIIGFTMGGLNYVVTVLQARARGMTLMRLPLTVWGIFVATILALLAFPALFVGAVMMTFDKLLGTSFFMPVMVEFGEQTDYDGGSPILFQHLFWFFGHPEVYIVALPGFGIVSDLLSVHARRNIFGYRMMVWAIVIIGGLSFIVWAHHMYVSGMDPYFGFFFATTTLIIAVPTALKVYNWVLTLWKADIHFRLPMLFAIAFIITFVNGGITGLFLGNAVVDVPLSDTMFVVAHFHMVMGVAPILVIFGAIYHWYPKITGRMLNEAMGQFHFWVTFLGA